MLVMPLVLTVALSASAAPARGGDEALWIDDFDRAVEVARKEKKDLLVDFTGSDWCGWCIRLDREVFSHDAFLDEVRDEYVLVKLDFPRGEEAKERVPDPQRNEELSREHAVQGFPTVLLMTPAGDVYGRTGYQPGGPEKYVQHLDQLRARGRKPLETMIAFASRFESTPEGERDELVQQAIEMMEGKPADTPGLQYLVEPVEAALALDPDNARGLKLRAVKALVGARLADAEVLAAAEQVDPRNEEGVLERAVLARCFSVRSREDVEAALEAFEGLLEHGAPKDRETAFLLHANAAKWYMDLLQDPKAAKRHARAALDIGTEDKNLRRMLDEIVAR